MGSVVVCKFERWRLGSVVGLMQELEMKWK